MPIMHTTETYETFPDTKWNNRDVVSGINITRSNIKAFALFVFESSYLLTSVPTTHSSSRPFPALIDHLFSTKIPSNPKPDRQRHTPKVIAIILYYTILEVSPEAVSALIDLKYGIYKVSPRDCRRRIEFTREDVPRKSRSWDWLGVAQEIAECVDRDTFMSLSDIDAECEELLSKYDDIPLRVLKDDNNLCKSSALFMITPVAEDAEQKACLVARSKEANDNERKAQEGASKDVQAPLGKTTTYS